MKRIRESNKVGGFFHAVNFYYTPANFGEENFVKNTRQIITARTSNSVNKHLELAFTQNGATP